MKIRTTEDLQNILDEDFAWRRKELATLYNNLQASEKLSKSTNLRVGVVMLYAHWEGFIKNAAESYLVFVACKKLNISELSSSMVALTLKGKLEAFEQTNKNTLHTQMVNYLFGNLEVRAQIPTEKIINTQSNLNFNVLREILSIIGVDYTMYELKERFIDNELLSNRNSVAHGQNPQINLADFEVLYEEITNLMRSIKTEILNNASQNKFKKVISGALVA